MIIGLSGYAGSGKDTVGSIIQYLTSGKEYLSGKRSYNSFLIDVGHGFIPEWEIRKFAYKLKEIASMLTGIPIHMFEDQEFKKSYLGPEWNKEVVYSSTAKNHGIGGQTITSGEEPMTVREFLQRLGTEAMRNGLHSNVWVNALFADYVGNKMSYLDGKLLGRVVDHRGRVPHGKIDLYKEREVLPNWIITDVRFPNEAQAIKDRNGVVVRVNRFKSASLEDKGKLHPSETSLDDWSFDYTIENNSTIEKLKDEVTYMLDYFKLLR